MPTKVVKVGEVEGMRVDRMSSALFGPAGRTLATWVTSGQSVIASQWNLDDQGGIALCDEQDMGAGEEPAIAAIGGDRLLALCNGPAHELHGLWFCKQERKGNIAADSRKDSSVVGFRHLSFTLDATPALSPFKGQRPADPDRPPAYPLHIQLPKHKFSSGWAAVLCRSSNSKMRLALWRVDASEPSPLPHLPVKFGIVSESSSATSIAEGSVALVSETHTSDSLTGGDIVCAYRRSDGNTLGIAVYHATIGPIFGSLMKLDEVAAQEEISQVRVLPIAASQGRAFVTVVKSSAGILHLIGWRVNGAAQITRWVEKEAGPVSTFDIAQVGPREIVVAARTVSGALHLNYYRFPLMGVSTQAIKTMGVDPIEPTVGQALSVQHRRLSSAPSDLGETIAVYQHQQTGKLKIARWRVTEN